VLPAPGAALRAGVASTPGVHTGRYQTGCGPHRPQLGLGVGELLVCSPQRCLHSMQICVLNGMCRAGLTGERRTAEAAPDPRAWGVRAGRGW
jgi:hypothetical protein